MDLTRLFWLQLNSLCSNQLYWLWPSWLRHPDEWSVWYWQTVVPWYPQSPDCRVRALVFAQSTHWHLKLLLPWEHVHSKHKQRCQWLHWCQWWDWYISNYFPQRTRTTSQWSASNFQVHTSVARCKAQGHSFSKFCTLRWWFGVSFSRCITSWFKFDFYFLYNDI